MRCDMTGAYCSEGGRDTQHHRAWGLRGLSQYASENVEATSHRDAPNGETGGEGEGGASQPKRAKVAPKWRK
eukprot:9493611-Pyramimonas_sp.AAC.1